MSDKPTSRRGQATDSVHAGELRQQEANAITTPIYQTSTFWFENSAKLRRNLLIDHRTCTA